MILVNPRLFNPVYWHLKPLLRDPRIRFIFIEGGSSASKTFTIAQALLMDQAEHDYSTLAFRRFNVHIKDTVYSSFKLAAQSLEMYNSFYHFQDFIIKSKTNDARIRFRGLDDPEAIKGMEDYNVIYNNEWSQFLAEQWAQQRKRLRGRPNQKLICDWNPISSKLWQYEDWIDKDDWYDLPLTIEAPTAYSSLNSEFAFKRINKAGNAIWIKITHRDNFWIVGHPSGEGGFLDQGTLDDFEYDRVHKPNFYRIYANGERGVIRTGGEYFKQFDETRHVRPLKLEELPIHVSVDENRLPYVTVSCWQYVEKNIRQVHEIPCKAPDNNAPKAARRLIRWLVSIDYKDPIFLYGDPSGNNGSTVDINNASFFDKFIQELKDASYQVINRIGKSHPAVGMSGSFVNDIYEAELYGYSITIGDSCKVSIDDYINVKEDPNGKMLKPNVKDKETGISYEPQGHFSDAKRYFITSLLKAEFERYRSKQKKYIIQST